MKINKSITLTRYGWTFGIRNGNRPTAFWSKACDVCTNKIDNNMLIADTIWNAIIIMTETKLSYPFYLNGFVQRFCFVCFFFYYDLFSNFCQLDSNIHTLYSQCTATYINQTGFYSSLKWIAKQKEDEKNCWEKGRKADNTSLCKFNLVCYRA